jgi:hypothetical protein
MIETIINNTIYLRGKNALDNKNLIDSSEKEWYWFHLYNYPSCHVVICKDKITIKEARIAKQIIMNNTKYKEAKEVCYTKIKNLIHGSDIGSVNFVSESSVKNI